MHRIGRLRGDESFKRFVRKLTTRRNLGNQTEHPGEDFPQTRQAVGFVNLLELGQIPKLLWLLEEQTADALLDGGPVLIIVCLAQNRIAGDGFVGLLREPLAIHLAVNPHSEKANLIADDTGHRIGRGIGEIVNADATTTAGRFDGWFAFR